MGSSGKWTARPGPEPGARRRFVLWLLPWIVGCAGARHPATRSAAEPLVNPSRGEVTARINTEAASVTSIKGKCDLAMRVAPGGPVKHCRGVIASRSPWGGPDAPGLYLKGYRRLVPTLFTLVSDGREFWLHVPSDNVAYTGPLGGPRPADDRREIRLDPADLFRALFLEPIALEDSVEVSREDEDYVVTVFRDHRPRRRLWVDRRAFTVTREVAYGPGAEPLLRIERGDYTEIDGKSYPRRLVLSKAADGDTLLLEFDSITMDPDRLGDGIFLPRIPAGTSIRRTDSKEARP
jgi:hypothetical protein